MKYMIVLGIRPDIINYQPIVKELEKRKIPSQMELYYKLYGYPIQK